MSFDRNPVSRTSNLGTVNKFLPKKNDLIVQIIFKFFSILYGSYAES